MSPTRTLLAAAAALLSFSIAAPARADLQYTFDSDTYGANVGSNVLVSVYLKQGAVGTQVGAGNELLTAGFSLSYLTASAPITATGSAASYGPAWDTGTTSNADTSTLTVLDVSLLSVFGVADFSSPVLLATFSFQATSAGVLGITLGDLDPGSPDFITINGDILDPTNTPSATITVTAAVVPEPDAFALILCAAPFLAGAATRRKRPSRTDA